MKCTEKKNTVAASLWCHRDDLTALRDLALKLDIKQPRSSVETGSLSGLIRRLAEAYRKEDAAVEFYMGRIFRT